MATLRDPLDFDKKTVQGTLCNELPENKVRCVACGHRCLINEGLRGICKVRFNEGGHLRVPFGYVSTIQCDPTEKKPFFHVLPGSQSLTFGMLGCDFHCAYCQNWESSQSVRDTDSTIDFTEVSSQTIVHKAQENHAGLVVSSYNEPLITAEWAVEVFKEAKKNGLKTAFVSNGNATSDVLKFIRPYTDAYKVDLKSMKQENYRHLGGKVSTVLDSITMIHGMGFWMEIVTLLIPGFNDSDKEIKDLAKFLVSISPEIPWHVTAFHKDYKMTDPKNTSSDGLIRSAKIGQDSGLKYVYAGNLPGTVENFEDTNCPSCRKTLVKRYGFKILENNMTSLGTCPYCKNKIPGIW